MHLRYKLVYADALDRMKSRKKAYDLHFLQLPSEYLPRPHSHGTKNHIHEYRPLQTTCNDDKLLIYIENSSNLIRVRTHLGRSRVSISVLRSFDVYKNFSANEENNMRII